MVIIRKFSIKVMTSKGLCYVINTTLYYSGYS